MSRNPNYLKCSCGLEVRWDGPDPIQVVDLFKFLSDGHSHHWHRGVIISSQTDFLPEVNS